MIIPNGILISLHIYLKELFSCSRTDEFRRSQDRLVGIKQSLSRSINIGISLNTFGKRVDQLSPTFIKKNVRSRK